MSITSHGYVEQIYHLRTIACVLADWDGKISLPTKDSCLNTLANSQLKRTTAIQLKSNTSIKILILLGSTTCCTGGSLPTGISNNT